MLSKVCAQLNLLYKNHCRTDFQEISPANGITRVLEALAKHYKSAGVCMCVCARACVCVCLCVRVRTSTSVEVCRSTALNAS